MKRRQLLVAVGAGVLVPLGALAQQPAKMYRIGVLDAASSSNRAERIEALRAGLRDLGYVENKNIAMEFRWAEGKYERIPELAAELVRANVDVLVAAGTPCTIAAKQATSTIPIVMVGVGDPVAAGIVNSLTRPRGNVTGMAIFSPELMIKRLEMFHETYPHAKQVAILINPNNPAHANSYKAAETAARSLKIGLLKMETKNIDEVKSAFATMTRKGAGALVLMVDTMFGANRAIIATIAEQRRLPTFGDAIFAEAGGLMGLGIIYPEMMRRTATYIDKILKGAKPGDLPVEQPTKFELIVNMRTARTLGVKIPQSILVQATKVIE